MIVRYIIYNYFIYLFLIFMKDYVGYEGLCYKVFVIFKMWDGVNMFCKLNKGSLVMISLL